MNTPPRPPGRSTGWDAVAVLAVVVLGLANVPAPFHGDQALYCLGAGQIDRGAVLYKDFWDLRQPGLFGAYLAAGNLFGFTDAGVHLSELLALTAFACVLPGATRPHLADGRLAALAPVLTVGFYYAVAGPWQLTQTEMLGSCLVFVAWRLAAPGAGPGRLLLAGVAGGALLGFKLLFAPLLVLAWAAVVTAAWRDRRPALTAAPLVAGIGAVWAPFVMYVVRHDAGPVVWQTYFDLPPRMLRELPSTGFGVLADGLIWFTGHSAPLLALGVVGAWRGWWRDPFVRTLVLWFAVGLVVILVQRRSWWHYQYLLVCVPVGLLAVRGVDRAAAHLRATGPVLAVAAVLLLPAAGVWGRKVLALIPHRFAVTAADRRAYQFATDGATQAADRDTAFLRDPAADPGPVYVFGHPLYYLAAGRDQAAALHGWATDVYLPDMWADLADQLRAARPAYVFVSNGNADLIRDCGPGVAAVLRDLYREHHRAGTGVWYRLGRG